MCINNGYLIILTISLLSNKCTHMIDHIKCICFDRYRFFTTNVVFVQEYAGINGSQKLLDA